MKNDNAESNIPSENITYAFAHLEAKLAEIARNLNQPEQELREWMGILFLSSGTGIINNLSSLSENNSRLYKTKRKMEMDGVTHRKPQRSYTPRKVGHTKKGFKYNGTHWTQQPKNKKRLQALARAKFEKKKVA